MGRLKSKARIGSITINGEKFPAAINTAVMIEMEDAGISLEEILSDESRRWKMLVWLIVTIINTGERLSGSDERVTDAEVADAIDIADLADITGQIAVLLGQSGRTVIAEPPKKSSLAVVCHHGSGSRGCSGR